MCVISFLCFIDLMTTSQRNEFFVTGTHTTRNGNSKTTVNFDNDSFMNNGNVSICNNSIVRDKRLINPKPNVDGLKFDSQNQNRSANNSSKPGNSRSADESKSLDEQKEFRQTNDASLPVYDDTEKQVTVDDDGVETRTIKKGNQSITKSTLRGKTVTGKKNFSMGSIQRNN